MANPRQRRKSRSGTGKVKLSVSSRKNMHKVVLKAPAVLIENWDRTKTVRQNYARLGLMPNLNPRQAGGIEPVESVPFAVASAIPASFSDLEDGSSDEDEDDEDEEMNDGPVASTSAPRKLAKGEGRIVRDADGKIIGVVYGGEHGEQVEEAVVERVRGESDDEEDEGDSSDEEQAPPAKKAKTVSPWGPAMKDWSGEESGAETDDEVVLEGPRSRGQGIPIGAKKQKVAAKTAVVEQLERLAALQVPVVRHTSALEADWLLDLIAKYGDDTEKMARDRKANPWQKTSGEIRRAVTKAGGFSKLKAKLARKAADANVTL